MSAAHLLLIDDEEPLLNLMESYLKRLNYTVEKAADGSRALTLFQQDPTRFQLIVADLSLPDRKGDELALQLHTINPEVKILLCSGYPFEIEQLPVRVRPSFATLQKPWLPKMLAQSIKELLERH
jgi:CheY-like chemotaxis protein